MCEDFQKTGGVWIIKPFTNWKKATEKMKDHEESGIHIQASLAVLAAQGAL